MKMKRKTPITALFLVLIVCFFCKTDAKAASVYTTGYTEDQIHYVIYDLSPSGFDHILSNRIQCTMQAVYEANITPPSTMRVTKIISGVKYSGLLPLDNYHIENNQTIATYSGYLYPES